MLVSAKNSESVPVSREIAGPAPEFILRQEMNKERGVLVGWENTGFNGTYVIRNEPVDEGGLVSYRPSPLDMKILSIIGKEHLRSVEDYARWLKNNFTYKKDSGVDAWAGPEETLANRSGDCKDFSLLNAAFLRVFGYRPRLFALARLYDSHAVCVFERGGRYLWFDNTTLKETPASTIEEFKAYIGRNQRMYVLHEVDLAAISRKSAGAQTPNQDDVYARSL